MNILICDDDKLYVDMIRKYVDEFFDEHKITDYKVYEYNSGDEAAKNNEKIDIANEEVKKLAHKLDAKYIDVNAPLKDEKSRLKKEYTYEGVHIKEEGYKAIYPLVKNYILE